MSIQQLMSFAEGDWSADELELRQRLHAGETIVVNKKQKQLVEYAKQKRKLVQIGRPSKWGNPFKIGRDGDREHVIAAFEKHIQTQSELLEDIHELKGKALCCYCSPLPCHGDVLKSLADGGGQKF